MHRLARNRLHCTVTILSLKTVQSVQTVPSLSPLIAKVHCMCVMHGPERRRLTPEMDNIRSTRLARIALSLSREVMNNGQLQFWIPKHWRSEPSLGVLLMPHAQSVQMETLSFSRVMTTHSRSGIPRQVGRRPPSRVIPITLSLA